VKRYILFILFSFSLVLSACSQSEEEKIIEHMKSSMDYSIKGISTKFNDGVINIEVPMVNIREDFVQHQTFVTIHVLKEYPRENIELFKEINFRYFVEGTKTTVAEVKVKGETLMETDWNSLRSFMDIPKYVDHYDFKIKSTAADQLESLETENKRIEEELKSYKDFVDSVVNTLDEKELKSLAQTQWEYRLLIDDQRLTGKQSEIEITKTDFKLRLEEKQAAFLALPNEIHTKGKISGHMREHLKITPSNYETTAPAGTNVDSIIYTFKNVEKGSVIELVMTEELKERLGVDKGNLKITVK
jgi:hypothetical protein